MIHELSNSSNPALEWLSPKSAEDNSWSEQLQRETATRNQMAGRFLVPHVLFRPWSPQAPSLREKTAALVSEARRSR